MSISVVDLNEEAKEEAPAIDTIEEEETKETVVDVVNEVVEEVNEPPKEQPKEEVKEQPKRQTQKDRINCPRCFKEMSVKSYKYSHEQKCQGKLSEKPVKKHTNPRPKQIPKPKPTPKPPPEIYYSSSEEEEQPTQPLIKKKQQTVPVQPINPVDAMAQHYMILQQQMIQQKQERYNKICSNMFAPRCLTRGSQALRPKKR